MTEPTNVPTKKLFIRPDEVRNHAFRLAARIFADRFYPNVIYIALRGGASMGNPVSEFFKWKRSNDPSLGRVFFAAVAARSYTGIGAREAVRVDGWTYAPEHLRAGDKVLLVDDVFDQGRTINHLVGLIMNQGIPREDIKVVVHDYKHRTFEPELAVLPDYWWQMHEFDRPEDDPWIHYLSHELEGLTEEEMLAHLCPEDPALARLLLDA